MLVGNWRHVFSFMSSDTTRTFVHRLVEFCSKSDFAGSDFYQTGSARDLPFGRRQNRQTHMRRTLSWLSAGTIPKISSAPPGMIDADWQRKAGEGTHATPQADSTCIILWVAAGPDFRRGQTDDLPTGNVDLAPTILHILGIQTAAKKWTVEFCPKQWRAAIKSRLREKRKRRQSKLKKISREGVGDNRFAFAWGSTIYLDEGNGSFAPKTGGSSD